MRETSSNNKMFSFWIFSVAVLVYFWYFYHPPSIPYQTKPAVAPPPPDPFNLVFHSTHPMFLKFSLNGRLVWQHAFLYDSYLVQSDRIVPRNDCYPHVQPTKIAAKGLSLYRYLKTHPDHTAAATAIQQNSRYSAHQQGTPFYFNCQDRDIQSLNVCPSGTFFQNDTCIAVSSCTGKPDGTKLPLHTDIRKYILCKNSLEIPKDCPRDTFFYHDRCIRQDDLTYHCQLYDTIVPLKLDEETLFECRHQKPIFTKCPPGTKLFPGGQVCESIECVGRADYERLPLLPRETRHAPFHYISGYKECLGDRVVQTVECPSEWDVSLSQGDNLTWMPMVFHGQTCSIPTFCENVFSDDPEVIAPVYEFTKHVQNWTLSDSYDRSAGYMCQAGRKRKSLDPGMRISKHFKIESGCGGQLKVLSVDGKPDQYYDCLQQKLIVCQADAFFDGERCKIRPEHAFEYRNIPFFQFDSLNSESWIRSWDYVKDPVVTQCESHEYQYVSLYNTCIHNECTKYPFLSMAPGLTILLPRPDQARCQLDTTDQHIKREPVSFDYTYWDQQILPGGGTTRSESCTFGEKIQSGHFVWDSSVYATCDPIQPFVFCPSTLTTELVQESQVYACGPPTTHLIRHTETLPNSWTLYTTNEFQRLLPTVPNEVTTLRLNKFSVTSQLQPTDTLEIPIDTPLNLQTDKPLDLQLRYRVTHPPNVAFQYDDQGNRSVTKVGGSGLGFVVRYQKFTQLVVNFPTYTPQVHVDGFSV